MMVAGTADSTAACESLGEWRVRLGDSSTPVLRPDGRQRRPDGTFVWVPLTPAQQALTAGAIEEVAREDGCSYDAGLLEFYQRRDSAGLVARLGPQVKLSRP